MGRLKCLKPPLAQVFTHGWKPDTIRGSRHERGYGKEWEALRKIILERDSWLCQPCLQVDRVSVAYAVDHRTPKSRGGTDEPANLQAICRECHGTKTQKESRGE